MARPPGSQNKRTLEMVTYSEADGRLSPAKAMIEYYMMNLDAFPHEKKAYPGMVAVALARRIKNLKHDLGVDVYNTLNVADIKAMVEYEVLQRMFPAMPRVVAMKEVGPYCHSKMPAQVNLDISDNRVAEHIAKAQARLTNRLIDAVKALPPTPNRETVDVTPTQHNSPIASVIGRAGE